MHLLVPRVAGRDLIPPLQGKGSVEHSDLPALKSRTEWRRFHGAIVPTTEMKQITKTLRSLLYSLHKATPESSQPQHARNLPISIDQSPIVLGRLPHLILRPRLRHQMIARPYQPH